MWRGSQQRESDKKGVAPVSVSLFVDWARHVPDDEVVIIAVCDPRTKSGFGPL
jgi:hypothetical protein